MAPTLLKAYASASLASSHVVTLDVVSTPGKVIFVGGISGGVISVSGFTAVPSSQQLSSTDINWFYLLPASHTVAKTTITIGLSGSANLAAIIFEDAFTSLGTTSSSRTAPADPSGTTWATAAVTRTENRIVAWYLATSQQNVAPNGDVASYDKGFAELGDTGNTFVTASAYSHRGWAAYRADGSLSSEAVTATFSPAYTNPYVVGSTTASGVIAYTAPAESLPSPGVSFKPPQTRAVASSPTGYAAVVLADSPLAYYRLNEATSATTVADSSGNSRTANVTGTLTSATGLLTGDTDTALSSAATAVAIAPYAAWQSVSSFTAECWVKPSALGGARTFVARFDGWVPTSSFSPSSFSLRASSGGNLEACIFYSGNNQALNNGSSLSTGVRYHLAMTYDGTTARVYLNGVQDFTISASGMNAGTLGLSIARAQGAEAFEGVIDEVAYYGTALSAGRILAHYNAGI